MDLDETYANSLFFRACSDEKCFNPHSIIFLGHIGSFFAQKWQFFILSQLLELTRRTKH